MKLLTLLIISSSFLFMACEEDQELVFKAQECLNNLGPAQTSEAVNCYNIVAGVGGQQAAIVRCSAKLIEGGLIDSRYVTAFDYFNDNETGGNESNRDAYLMSLFALTPSSLTTVVHQECTGSGLPGQGFIAGLAVAGTVFRDLLGFDPSDPNSINSGALDGQLSACAATPGSCDDAQIEIAVGAISSAYCTGEKLKEEICVDIAAAEASGTTAESFYCAIQDKTYNGTTCI